ncbi:MAG: hypothetical protein AB9869_09620 [Verrucomicrobiia bacterium]
MGYTELSLPVDIPWKRLGVSGDMLDRTYGNLSFPKKWDTSIAAFYHEPAEVDPAYCHRKITYLKIVCTITNYGLNDNDVSVLNELRRGLRGGKGFKEFEANVTRSYPCHGCLLQVSVFPNPDGGVALHDYPYISSMQPRKRELYEVATQSGEVSSQSANKLNVMKGNTTTGTTEDYDLDMGGGSGGHSGIFGLWSEQHSGEQKQVGTIQRRQTQDQNVATSDASRDRRESYSFSTSINQLHTLLQSYHLGTNRAMFFLQPTPHMQDAKFSFVRGLRRIEGIQEFFLIINRPAHVKGFCLEAALETAHLDVRRAYYPRLIPLSDLFSPGNLAKTDWALGIDVTQNSFFKAFADFRDAWNSWWPTDRLAAQKDGWYPSTPDEARASEVIVKVPEIGIQDAALIFEEYEASTGKFFVAGRRFCVCWEPKENATPLPEDNPHAESCEESSSANISGCDRSPGSIVYEGLSQLAPIHYRTAQSQAQYQNALTASLNQELAASLLSSNRSAYGKMSFFSTEVMLEELTELARTSREALPIDRPVADFRAIRALESRESSRAFPEMKFLDFIQLPTESLVRKLDIAADEARRIRLEVLLEALGSVNRERLQEADPDGRLESRQARDERSAAAGRGTAVPGRQDRTGQPG